MVWATRKEMCTTTQRKFNAEAPFLKILFDNVMNRANKVGHIRTILGRKARFDFWTPSFDQSPVKTREAAEKKYPDQQLNRAFVSKALNRLIQGSAADQAKKAMVDHDEINCMVNSKQESLDLKLIMENAIPLKVPVVADIDLGPTWC
jgi:DNA polymerase I-like protein with 3'-5' exonuclease and polymerase domains